MSTLTPARSSDISDLRSERIQAWFEWPVVIAASLTIPIIVIQESDLGGVWRGVSTVLNWATWSVFAAEVVVMLFIVRNRRRWIRGHLIDVAVTVLTPPFAPAVWQAGRAFRLVRLLRLVRLFSLRRLLSLQGMKYAAFVVAATVVVGGAVFASVEKVDNHGNALTTWDGVWWATTTVTTVGYGDIFPSTDGGRAIAMSIMLVGIGFVALLTAFIADRFINQQRETEAKEDLILAELREIRSRLDSLETRGEAAQESN
ncbi:MAG TPA: potassium channel family protein [Solirubrobacterales bacterium]